MDFTLSEEHQAFADSVARFAQDKLAAGALERAHSPHYPWETASLLAEQGLLGIAFPEADGGQGGSLMHAVLAIEQVALVDRKSTRLNSSHLVISYAVFCLKKKKTSSQLLHHRLLAKRQRT